MSTTLSFVGKQIIIYGGTPVFVAGVIGGLLNTLEFLGLFLRITTVILGVDGTETSLFFCKWRYYFSQLCVGTSLTCLCLATIDQYFATCSRPRWQQFCNIKLAQRLVIVTIIIWSLHGIPYLLFNNHIVSSITNKVTCTNTNDIFGQYRTFGVLLVLVGYLPVVITTLFGWMAYCNVQQIAYRTMPLVRRELDKQLTVMVLVQVVINICTLLPFTTINAIATNPNLIADPVTMANVQFVITIAIIFYYITFASPFYIYICASERFRRQLIYVLFTIHLNRWKRPMMCINQVTPET